MCRNLELMLQVQATIHNIIYYAAVQVILLIAEVAHAVNDDKVLCSVYSQNIVL